LSRIELIRREARELRFLAYHTFCGIGLSEDAPAGLWDEILAEAERLRQLLDFHDPESALSRRDFSCGELRNLALRSLEIAEATGGAFDPTVGPLCRLWDFSGEEPKLPDGAVLAAALERVGYRNVLAALRNGEAPDPGMELDLGGAGKGYIAERFQEMLLRRGVSSGSVNLGGNLMLIGSGPRGNWRIGVQAPWAARGLTVGALALPGGVSVSSSGGYDRYFERDGKVYHHLLDPRTGYPVETDVIGTTVVSADPVLADALSTALFVGGTEALSPAIAEKAEYVIVRKDGEIEISDGLAPRFSPMAV